MSFDVENPLKRQSSSPENGNVAADGTGKAAPVRQFIRVEEADQTKGGNRQDDIGAVDPVHLPMQARQDGQFGLPFQLEWYERRGDQYAQLSPARQKDQCRQPFLH